jgi:hypothetical protein
MTSACCPHSLSCNHKHSEFGKPHANRKSMYGLEVYQWYEESCFLGPNISIGVLLPQITRFNEGFVEVNVEVENEFKLRPTISRSVSLAEGHLCGP